MKAYLLAMFLIVLAVPSYAKITETKTVCGLTDCYSLFDSSADLTAVVGNKATPVNGIWDYGKFLTKKGTINNTVIEVMGKNTIKISGTIAAGSHNLFGFSILGDESNLNSTWWNSSFGSYLTVIKNFTDTVPCILYPVNGTNGINTANLITGGLQQKNGYDTAFIYSDNLTENTRWFMASYNDLNYTYGNNTAKTTLFLLYNGTDITDTAMYIASPTASYLRNISFANIFSCVPTLTHYYEFAGTTNDAFNYVLTGDSPMSPVGAIYNASGMYGYGVSFVNGQYFITAALSSPIAGKNVAGMSAWVVPRSQLMGDVMGIVPTSGGCIDECFWIESQVPIGSDTARLGCGLDTNSGGGMAVSYKVTLGAWTHIFCNKNTTHISIYLNGVMVNSSANSGTWASATRPLSVGSHPNNYGVGTATVDSVKFYNTNQTDAYILAEYNARYGLYFGNMTTNPPPSINYNVSFFPPTPEDNLTTGFDLVYVFNVSAFSTVGYNLSLEMNGVNHSLTAVNNFSSYIPTLSGATVYSYIGYIIYSGNINRTERRTLILSGMTQTELDARFKITDLTNLLLIFAVFGLLYMLVRH